MPTPEDIYILPQDLRAFEPWLPINGGNRTVLLLGQRGGGGADGGGGCGNFSGDGPDLGEPVVLDFGAAVNLLYHPVR